MTDPVNIGANNSSFKLRTLFPTVVAAAAAAVGIFVIWTTYMQTPWTRDGTVRAYVSTITPQVSGRVIQLPVKADQFVKKGELLMVIDPSDYQIEVDNADATVSIAEADFQNKQAEANRREKLNGLAISQETEQTALAASTMAAATLKQAKASLERARLDMERTHIYSPVDGYVTNLLIQPGDYATSGQRSLSIIDSASFWVDAYFEETLIRNIAIGDRASIKLMAFPEVLDGLVAGVGRGISVPNAEADDYGLATVNPVFTWVRLAQRVPVRIELNSPVPKQIHLTAGMTATVSVGK